MRLVRHPHKLAAGPRGCVATIGNFDGVHLGHQAVIRQLRTQADRLDLPAVVLTFEPQPQEYFAPERAPARLTSFREKAELLAACGVDVVCCLRFGESLAGQSPADFAERLLVRGLGVKSLVIGDDFRFGKGRTGDVDFLAEFGRHAGFDVLPTQTCLIEGERVGSGRIRTALAGGRFETAAELLGRPYSIRGRVVHGDKRGRVLGFPTANIGLRRRRPPLHGIYAVTVRELDDRSREGVASVGTRPVFDGGEFVLETFLFDFDEDLYGRRVSVEFRTLLRPERDFPSVEALQAQMHEDVEAARAYFKRQRVEAIG